VRGRRASQLFSDCHRARHTNIMVQSLHMDVAEALSAEIRLRRRLATVCEGKQASSRYGGVNGS